MQRLLITVALICIAAVAIFVGCKTEWEEEEGLPLIPVGRILDRTGANVPDSGMIYGGFQFELTWKEAASDTISDGIYGPNIVALKDLLLKWRNYAQYVRPQPHFPPQNANEIIRTGVWNSDGKLINNPSDATLVIQRAWNPAWGTLTVQSWPGTREKREAAFKAAQKEIQEIMASLKASPFWDAMYIEGSTGGIGGWNLYPLQELYADMENFSSTGELTGAALYADRGFEAVDKDPLAGVYGLTGDLYGLFFGPIPVKGDYAYTASDAEYVFPVE
jgi:hypothetical protein